MIDTATSGCTFRGMSSEWTNLDDLPTPAAEQILGLARGHARSCLQCQVLTCLTAKDGLTLTAGAFRMPTKNEERIVQFLIRLWDLGYALVRVPAARRQFDVWWLTGLRDPAEDGRFPGPV